MSLYSGVARAFPATHPEDYIEDENEEKQEKIIEE